MGTVCELKCPSVHRNSASARVAATRSVPPPAKPDLKDGVSLTFRTGTSRSARIERTTPSQYVQSNSFRLNVFKRC